MITIEGVRYLIRGPYRPKQVRELYRAFKLKYPDNRMSLGQWAKTQGRVYVKMGETR